MRLYDGGRAPNPRRVRIFLAEKGMQVPVEHIDLARRQVADAIAAREGDAPRENHRASSDAS